jgi:hypothetical protein
MEHNSIHYHFEGPIPEAKFSKSQVSRLLGIAQTLTRPNLPEDLEEMAFAVVSRMVLGILIYGADRANRELRLPAQSRRAVPTQRKPNVGS